ELLDAFGHLQANLAEVRAQALRWRALDAEIRRLAGDDDRDARIERLRHELDELERWALAPEALAETVALPVNRNIFRMLSGLPAMVGARTTSIAIYELEKAEDCVRYYFLGATSAAEPFAQA
ncbi:MAG: hypothetical protein B7Z73_07460, partial [Planctomycetia bacterium 21-64-5]